MHILGRPSPITMPLPKITKNNSSLSLYSAHLSTLLYELQYEASIMWGSITCGSEHSENILSLNNYMVFRVLCHSPISFVPHFTTPKLHMYCMEVQICMLLNHHAKYDLYVFCMDLNFTLLPLLIYILFQSQENISY